MAFTRYLTLGLLTVAGAPMAFAQKPPEHADELYLEVEISSGGNLYTACRDNGFADTDLADCWGMALAANHAVIADPHLIQPGTFYLKKTPEMLAAEIASLKDAAAASAQAPTPGVSDDSLRAFSSASNWESQYNLVQGENQKLLTELGELKLENENLAADLGLAKNTLGYWQRIVQTMKDEAAKAPLDLAAAEEILRSHGPPPVNLDETTGVTFTAKDQEILFYKWISLGLGVSVLALAAALAWMARSRNSPNNPAPTQKPAKDRKTIRDRLSSLRERVVPKKAEGPRREPLSGADAKAYYAAGAPHRAAQEADLFPPAPLASAASAEPEPAPIAVVPPLGPPDNRGFYYVEHAFVLKEKYLLKGHSATRRTTVRFTPDLWQARLPQGGWANLLADYAKKLVEQSDCFDRNALMGDGFTDDPTMVFENPPTHESFTSRIPAKVVEEVAP